MKKFVSTVLAGAMALATVSAAVAPVSAAPWSPAGVKASSGNVENVRWRRHDVRRRGDHYYYHGHRVYRHWRPGYRYYDGWWLPPALFLGGVIITTPQYDYRHMPRAHVAWCYDHYRSYREWDNSFQPFHGPRRQCVSPYFP